MKLLRYKRFLKSKCSDVKKSGHKAVLNRWLIRSLPYRKNAVGIAGNQIDLPYNIFSMYNGKKWITVMNPVIVQSFGKEIDHKEGCLSLKKDYSVKRYTHIEVKYKDKDWNDVNVVLDGMNAIVFQHEFDHLQGVLINEKG